MKTITSQEVLDAIKSKDKKRILACRTTLDALAISHQVIPTGLAQLRYLVSKSLDKPQVNATLPQERKGAT